MEIDFASASLSPSYESYILRGQPWIYYRLKEASGTVADDLSDHVDGTYANVTLNQTASKPVSAETASRYILMSRSGSPGQVRWTGKISGKVAFVEALIWIDALGAAGDRHRIYEIFEGGGGVVKLNFDVFGNGKLRVWSGANEGSGNDAGVAGETATGLITAGTWYHVAFGMDVEKRFLQIWVNGARVTTTVTEIGSPGNSNYGWQQYEILSDTYSWEPETHRFGSSTLTRPPVHRLAEPAVFLYIPSDSVVGSHHDARSLPAPSAPVWVDVTSRLRSSLSIKRGRSMELNRIEPASLELTLDNQDRALEPGYAASPYYPNVKPRRKIRVRAVHNAITYNLFTGYIKDFPQDSPAPTDNVVPISALDVSAFLNQIKLDESYDLPQQSAGNRISQLLKLIGWPDSDKVLDAGRFNVQPEPGTLNSSLTEHLMLTAASDGGIVFMRGDGYVVFHDGNHRTTATRSVNNQGTFSDRDVAGKIPYDKLKWDPGADFIFNEIKLSRQQGLEQFVQDFASVNDYWPSSHSDTVNLANDSDVFTRASELLAKYKDPKDRFTEVHFIGALDTGTFGDSIWPHILGVEISDKYTVERRPMGIGVTNSKVCFVESIQMTIGDAGFSDCDVTWGLSLA